MLSVINNEVFKDFIILKIMLFVTWLTLFVLPKNEWLHSLEIF
jgi:hypothetical protein